MLNIRDKLRRARALRVRVHGHKQSAGIGIGIGTGREGCEQQEYTKHRIVIGNKYLKIKKMVLAQDSEDGSFG